MSEPSNPTSGSASSPELRAGTAEREAAEARLRHATGLGALDLEEFAQRMELLLRARTRGEVEKVVSDLPATTAPRPTAARRTPRRWIVAIMGGEETHGRWRPAPRTTAVALMGEVKADLREAELDQDEIELDAYAIMGGVEVIVPEGVAVDVRGFSLMGGRDVSVRQPASDDAPVVTINAYAVMGSVEVRNPKGGDPATRQRPEPVAVSRHLAVPHGRVPAHPPRRRWVGKAIAAAAIAWFTAPIWLPGAGAMSVFGSRVHTVTDAALEDGGETVTASTAFGSVEIIVPDDVAVEQDGLVIFGSSDCEPCAETVEPGAPTVRVRTFGGFGSIEVLRQSEALRQDDSDD